jgi:hypothetical protein
MTAPFGRVPDKDDYGRAVFVQTTIRRNVDSGNKSRSEIAGHNRHALELRVARGTDQLSE